MVSLNKALSNPYFWRGYIRGGGWLAIKTCGQSSKNEMPGWDNSFGHVDCIPTHEFRRPLEPPRYDECGRLVVDSSKKQRSHTSRFWAFVHMVYKIKGSSYMSTPNITTLSLHIQGPFKTLTGIFTLNPSGWWMQKRPGSKKNSWSYPRIPSTRINDSRYWLNWTLTSAGAGATGSLGRSKWWDQNNRSGNPKTDDLEKATQILSILVVS